MARRLWCFVPVMLLVAAGLLQPAAAADPPAWDKISTTDTGVAGDPGVYRSADGVLHVVNRQAADLGVTLLHTAIDADGAVLDQSSVLTPGWAVLGSAPSLIGDGDGLRAVFGGRLSAEPGFWSADRNYTATAPADGGTWTLPEESLGASHPAYGEYDTTAVELADGTPVTASSMNNILYWHVGNGDDADTTYDFTGMPTMDLTLVRSGDAVWLAWYARANLASLSGTFVKQILPEAGPTMKVPQSSQGKSSLSAGRVAMVTGPDDSIRVAFCVGYPTCDHVGIWEVGSADVTAVPSSAGATKIAASSDASGRMWIAWSDDQRRIRALRTDPTGTDFGAVQTLAMPDHEIRLYSLAVEGSAGPADLVVNPGDGIWHTHLRPRLSVGVTRASWRHDTARRAAFTVTDAGVAVAGAQVRARGLSCTTSMSGRCAIRFPATTRSGPVLATAAHDGYTTGSTRLVATAG